MYSKDMFVDVEMLIPFPCRIAHLEWRHDGKLAITRNQVEIRIDFREELVERNRSVEHRHTSDVKRNLLAFEVQESGVRPR